MDQNLAVEVLRQTVMMILKLGTPLLLIGLVIGVVISLIQALTQIQEPTLSFVPKLIVILLCLVFLLPNMIQQMTIFTNNLFDKIVNPSRL
jgi:flagellar biosynthesis protein FliQ